MFYKFLIFLVFVSQYVYSEPIKERRLSEDSDLIYIQEKEEIFKLNQSWKSYLIDKCEMFDRNVENEEHLRSLGLRRCKDQSVSFVQPDSEGWNGWQGKCGQTAAVNSLYQMCRIAKSPKDYMDRYLSDLTPGVRPRTLRKGLNKVMSYHDPCPSLLWSIDRFRRAQSFTDYIIENLTPLYSHPQINRIKRDNQEYLRQPVIALIQNPGSGKYLHWVTIIDYKKSESSCDLFINHWDDQYKVPCNVLEDWSRQVGRSYPIILSSYTLISID